MIKIAKESTVLFIMCGMMLAVIVNAFLPRFVRGQGITIGNGQITGAANLVYDVAAGTNTTITTNGTLRTVNVISPTVTQTNFIGGQFYTNNSGRLQQVNCSVQMVGAAVAGTLVTELQVGNGATMSTLTPIRKTTVLVVGLTFTDQYALSGFVQPGQVFCITNTTVTGIGNSATIVAGSGQLTTY
jgi:hypothetical protein